MGTETERTTTTISARIPKALRSDLEALAKATGRNKNTLIEQALQHFVEVERWQIALIEDRVRQADAGNFATDAEVRRVYAKFNLVCGDQRERSAG